MNSNAQVSIDKQIIAHAAMKFVVQNNLSFTIVNAPELQQLMTMAFRAPNEATIQLPSANTIREKALGEFDALFPAITEWLSKQEKISLTIDTWSSSVKNGASDYMGVVAHFIDEDWKPKTLLIGFEPLEQRHTGT